MSGIEHLLAVMARLRDPQDGCPWDLQQTLASLTPYTIEEAYEVEEAAHAGDMARLRDELGDLLFQVVFYARIAEEQGDFDFDAVAAAVAAKLERRHPHVFGDTEVRDADEQTRLWESIKAAERAGAQRHGALDGVSRSLPALMRAEKLQRRAARTGFDWDDIGPVFDKVVEELAETREAVDGGEPARITHEIGDLLFACVNLARHAGVDAEQSLRRANARFERRFAAMEARAREQGEDFASLDPDRKESLWEAVKAEE